MPRTARGAPGGLVFHVLNRGVARTELFEKPADYQAFERVLREIIGRPVAREKLAAIKMPPLSKIARVELPSHIANIGPVPLSRSFSERIVTVKTDPQQVERRGTLVVSKGRINQAPSRKLITGKHLRRKTHL
jgi:hypothetical protein